MNQGQDQGRRSSRRGDRAALRARRHRTRARVFAGMLAVAAAAAATEASRAELVAGWHFNGAKPSYAIESDIGTGFIDLAGVGGNAELFSGTALNAQDEWRAGDALGLRGTAGDGGLYVSATLGDLIGTQSSLVTVSFATRRSATGFSMMRVETWGGAGWDVVETVVVDTDWTASSVTFAMDAWASGVDLRLTPIDATAGAGTFRLDNLLVDVTPVPAPGAIGLGAVAGMVGVSRRRRRGVEVTAAR